MKIQNKVVLLAIASVISTSIMPSMSRVWGGTVATQQPLEERIANAKALGQRTEKQLSAKVEQSKDYEKTAEFKKQPGTVVASYRKLRATTETALEHTKSHNAKLARFSEKLNTVLADLNKLMDARHKQFKEDTDAIADKKETLETAKAEAPGTSVAARYTVKGEMVSGSASL